MTKRKRQPSRPIHGDEKARSAVRVSPPVLSQPQVAAAPQWADSDPRAWLALQRQLGNRAVQRLLAQRDGRIPPKEAQKAAGPTPEDKEAVAKHFSGLLKGQQPKSKSQGGAVAQKAFQAALKTKPGKRLVRRTFKGRGKLGAAVLTLGSNAALWLANKTDALSTPAIRIAKNITASVEVKGTPKKPKSVMFKVTVRW